MEEKGTNESVSNSERVFISDDLQPQHRDFVKYYRQYRNAAKAARAAGYSHKSSASTGARLLGREDVSYVLAHPEGDEIRQEDMSEEEFDRVLEALARGQGQQALPAMKLLGERRGWIKKKESESTELPMPFAAEEGE